MKLLVQSAIFFGTLMAAAVVALGEPGQADPQVAAVAVARSIPASSSGGAGASSVLRMALGNVEAAAR